MAKKSPYHHTNIPHGSVHACHMLCTVYHGKWHVSTDANSVATHQFQVPVYCHTPISSPSVHGVSADPHGKQAGVQLTFPQPFCISIQVKTVEQ